MDPIKNAVFTLAAHARQQGQQTAELVEKKQAELGKQQKFNEAMESLEKARANGTISETEIGNFIAMAGRAGVTINRSEFTEFNTGRATDGQGVAYSNIEGTESWAASRRDQLDAMKGKLERALKADQDTSAQTDLKLKLALNEMTQSLQDANGAVASLKELKSAMTIGR